VDIDPNFVDDKASLQKTNLQTPKKKVIRLSGNKIMTR